MTVHICHVCKERVYSAGVDEGFIDLCHCDNCGKSVSGPFHKRCVILEQSQCLDCIYCTTDKSRMYVYDFHKIRYIVKYYGTSKEEYDELINELASFNSSIKKSYLDFNKIFMDETSIQMLFNDYHWKSLYEILIKKYKITNESIEEIIKDQLYRSRTGFFIKCATKE